MGNIITCIDGSEYDDSVTSLSSWVHERTNFAISLLHVATPHSEIEVKPDMTGQIGLGSKSSLLEELTKIDEEHGRTELRKGQLMLKDAKEKLKNNGITQQEIIHRRGSLVDTISEIEGQAKLIVMGKYGEDHQATTEQLGSNLEQVARAIHTPLLIATHKVKPINKFLIAYDDSASANKAIEYVANNALFEGLECHLLVVSEITNQVQEMINKAKSRLEKSGIKIYTDIKPGKNVGAIVSDYIKRNNIDLLLIGAYGHSQIRSFLFGSTTSLLIRESEVPVMLFR